LNQLIAALRTGFRPQEPAWQAEGLGHQWALPIPAEFHVSRWFHEALNRLWEDSCNANVEMAQPILFGPDGLELGERLKGNSEEEVRLTVGSGLPEVLGWVHTHMLWDDGFTLDGKDLEILPERGWLLSMVQCGSKRFLAGRAANAPSGPAVVDDLRRQEFKIMAGLDGGQSALNAQQFQIVLTQAICEHFGLLLYETPTGARRSSGTSLLQTCTTRRLIRVLPR
jgi:hypothetical protein